MRTKFLSMSIGLAVTVWMTGCQSISPPSTSSKTACGSGSCSSTVASSAPTKTKRDPLSADLKQRKLPTALASNKSSCADGSCTSCSTCAKEGTGSTIIAAKDSITPCTACAKDMHKEVASCTSCNAKLPAAPMTASTTAATTAPCNTCNSKNAIAFNGPLAIPATPSTPIAHVAGTQIPGAGQTVVPATLPPVPNLPSANGTPQPIGPVYGAGVEVVAGQHNDPIATLPGERTTKDNVMTVRFGHQDNYQIVVGQLSQFRHTWRLRYAAIESEDKYGGSLTLVGENLDHLKDGQMVRVHGVVLPSDDRASGARYQVTRIEVLEPDVK